MNVPGTIYQLKDCILLNRFKIDEPLAQGGFGKVYSGVDLLNQGKPIVVKFSQSHAQLEKEFKALTEIERQELNTTGKIFKTVRTFAFRTTQIYERSIYDDQIQPESFDWSFIV